MKGAILAAATMLAAPAIGQSAWRDAPPEESRKVLHAFARCAAKAEPVLARRFVLLTGDERLPEGDFRRLFNGRCLGNGQLRTRAWQSRAALAEALISRTPAATRPLAFDTVAPLPWVKAQVPVDARVDGAALERENVAGDTEMLVGKLGECVVRANSASSLAVLETKLDTPAELDRIKVLTPVIAGCVQAGQTIAFNRTNLRNALALSYFRLANAPVALATGGQE